MERLRVLFLAATPHGPRPVAVGPELRAIREKLRSAQDRVDLQDEVAVRPEDLPGSLGRLRPHIVHFCGHGTLDNTLTLESATGAPSAVSKEWISELFRLLKGDLRAVVLNACYSAVTAAAVAEHIDCAIGMDGALDDRTSIAFSAAFYEAIALGQSVQTAYELGCLMVEDAQKDALRPELLPREGVDPSAIVLLPPVARAVPALLRWRWSRRAGVAVGCAVTLLTALIAGALLPWPDPVSPTKHGALLVGHWMATAEGRAFCGELARMDPRLHVQCLSPVLPFALRQAALRVGAGVLVEVGARGEAALWSPGHAGRDNLFSDAVHFTINPESRTRAMALVRAMARLGSPEANVLPRDVECPASPEAPVDSLTLAALLVVPACEAILGRMDTQKLLSPCNERGVETEECLMASFLYAVRCDGCLDGREVLRPVLAQGPLSLREAALAVDGRLACTSGDVAGAEDAARRLVRSSGACAREAAAVIAACVRVADPAREPELAAIEEYPIPGKLGARRRSCPEYARAGLAAWRGYHRLRAQRWAAAAADYKIAHELSHDPLHLVSLAEAHAHAGKNEEARRILDGIEAESLGTRGSTYRDLLRWWLALPADRDQAGQDLVRTYERVKHNQSAISKDDCDIRTLVCEDIAGECVVDVLASPQADTSMGRLRDALQRAGPR